jgi:hypothetical protein
VTAFALIFGKWVATQLQRRGPELSPESTRIATVLFGAVLGGLVSVSSVGAGAIGVLVLVLLYPKLPMARIV